MSQETRDNKWYAILAGTMLGVPIAAGGSWHLLHQLSLAYSLPSGAVAILVISIGLGAWGAGWLAANLDANAFVFGLLYVFLMGPALFVLLGVVSCLNGDCF